MSTRRATREKKREAGRNPRGATRNRASRPSYPRWSNRGTDEVWVRGMISWYGRTVDDYEDLGEIVRAILRAGAERHAPHAIVDGRAKTMASFANKLWRKITKYRLHGEDGRYRHEVTDLCGTRVICLTKAHRDAICQFIQNGPFEVDWANSGDKINLLEPQEFGYLACHYVVKLKPEAFPLRDLATGRQVWQSDLRRPRSSGKSVRPRGIRKGDVSRLRDLRSEIQVKTLLEHAWAQINHAIGYKSDFEIPDVWKRELARLAALLENADTDFSRIERSLQTYAASYAAYMTREEMRRRIRELETIQRTRGGREDADVAHLIGRLAMCLGDWGRAVAALERVADGTHAGVLRDLGVATCKSRSKSARGFRKGQRYLERAIVLDPMDSDAIASLGGTFRAEGRHDRARECYRQAHEADPSDPFPLGNLLGYEIEAAGDLSPVRLAYASIRAAIQRCRDQADVGMNTPWAHYDMGKFRLLLGEPYESLKAHAKAVSVSTAAFMIDTSLRTLMRMRPLREEVPESDWVIDLLSLAAARTQPKARWTNDVRKVIEGMRTPGATKPRTPMVVIAGSSRSARGAFVSSYGQLLASAFRRFQGTIISGPTRVGVGRLAGDLGERYEESLWTIGYRPSAVPRASLLERPGRRFHEIRWTGGDDYTPLEPLQMWADLITAGVRPEDVRVIGIGGGRIAATEYCIALALGAAVGVLKASGGAAKELLEDPDWRDLPRLVALPAEAAMIEAFIEAPSTAGSHRERERLARAIHEAYRRDHAAIARPDDPAMKEWDDLEPGLKRSNLRQADDIRPKLARVGRTVGKAGRGEKAAPAGFTRTQIETLAEREHARWYIERSLAGWRWAKEKDTEKRLNPCLVGWSELPVNVKEWDRQAVRAIPKLLADLGLKIVRES